MNPTPSPYRHLMSDREHHVIEHVANGEPYKLIAASLHISINTVKKHMQHICCKLGVQTKMEAVNKYFGRVINYSIPFLLYAFSECVDLAALFPDCL
jgi:DNA-binding CsgD family transcriptional regulator